MKNFMMLGVIVAILLAVAIPYSYADTVETVQPTAFLVKESDVNDAALTATTMNWADLSDWVDIPKGATTLRLKFYLLDTNEPDNETVKIELWVADYGCGAEQVFNDTTITFGTQQLSHNPVSLAELNSGDPCDSYTWADTIGTFTGEEWETTCIIQNESGDNDVGSILFHRQSTKKIWIRFHTFSLESTQTAYCVAYWY